MSDLRDQPEADDELTTRLRTALRNEVAAAPTPPVTLDQVKAGAARRDRQDRARVGAAILAAAAIVVAVVVIRLGSTEEAYVDLGPGDPKPPLHLVLDEASGHEIWTATQGLTADPQPSAGQPSLDDLVLFGGAEPLDAPWLLLAVYSGVAPVAPFTGVDGEQPVTVAGRPAVVRSFPDAGPTNGHQIMVSWDDGQTVIANFWGLTVEESAAALEGLQLVDGRFTLMGSGLGELARVAHPAVEDPAEASVTNYSPDAPAEPIGPSLSIRRDPGVRTEADLLASALPSYWVVDTDVERIDVRGTTGLMLTPKGTSERLPSALSRTTVVWLEAEHDAIVRLTVEGTDRDEPARLISHLRVADPDEWSSIIARCTDVVVGGTVATGSPGVTGGPCPGYEQRGG